MLNIFKKPVARKRFLRFKEHRLAYRSLWLLIILYLISLCSELICNSAPLYVRFNDRSYFPVFKFYPEDVFLHNGKQTRPDYKKIKRNPAFKANPDNFMLFPPLPVGPFESIDPESIAVADTVTVVLSPVRRIGTVNVGADYSIVRSASFGFFIPNHTEKKDAELKGLILTDYFHFSDDLKKAVAKRFENREAPRTSFEVRRIDSSKVLVSLSGFSPRRRPPRTVRLTFRETAAKKVRVDKIVLDPELKNTGHLPDIWAQLPEQIRAALLHNAKQRFYGPVDPHRFAVGEKLYSAAFEKIDVRFPYRPVKGHIMGIDGAGRDVLARILYGLRISLTFGLLLVGCSMILGIAAGAVQGYFGGLLDISVQRFIEIWSALPFLYIMILMGSIYGRSFSLLLFCYGLFNWIGISYYIRAEFLKLRQQPFVESAKCMGLSSFKIIFRHILPNAMVPAITFFPFSLVGAIGALAALDYLGFGLPPPTPSWGELLFQAQQYRWAWWLILYPSLALFIVMLLGVFIGEGIRNAYDPKRYTRLK